MWNMEEYDTIVNTLYYILFWIKLGKSGKKKRK